MVVQEAEDHVALQRRAIAAVETVRKADYLTGAKDGSGKPSKAWLAISESPEQQRRTKQMSKSKRAVLEGSDRMGKSVLVRADYKAGLLWMGSRQIAGLGRPPPSIQAATSAYGWLDTQTVAAATGETKQKVETRWQQLVSTIN